MFTYGSVAHWVGRCMLLRFCCCCCCCRFVYVCTLCMDMYVYFLLCVSHVLVYLPLIWYALFTFETNIWYFVTVHSLSRFRMNALCKASTLRALFRLMITHLFTSAFSYFFSFLYFFFLIFFFFYGVWERKKSQSVSLENLCAMNNFLLDIMVIYPLAIYHLPL